LLRKQVDLFPDLNNKTMFSSKQVFSSFAVKDINQANDFYSKILGLTVTKEAMGLLALHLDEKTTVMVYPKPDHSPASFTVLNLVVDDVDKAVDELTAAGVTFEQYDGEIKTDEKGISRGQGPSIAWFTDPFGNIMSVLSTM
jgi:predicted enzyme related to lactoylglutathione lyase